MVSILAKVLVVVVAAVVPTGLDLVTIPHRDRTYEPSLRIKVAD